MTKSKDGWESAHDWMARHSAREDKEFNDHRRLLYLARLMEETYTSEGEE